MNRLLGTLPTYLVVWLWLLPGLALAQPLWLDVVPQNLCAGASVPLNFTLTQPVAAGNTFRVELLNQFDQIIATNADNILPGSASIRIPPGLEPTPISYFLRIRSTNPVGSSNFVPLVFNAAPSATLLPPPAQETTLNPGDAFRATVLLRGGGPYELGFTDGTARNIDDVSRATVLLYPTQTRTYQLARVANGCGGGQVSGTATATVRAAGLLVTRLSTTEPCADKPLDIYFSTDRSLPQNTTFKVDFQPLDPQAAAFTVNATGNTSPLRVILPANPPGTGTYLVRLYSESANVSAFYRNQFGDLASSVLVRRAPVVQLSGTSTVGFGQTAQLQATLTGLSAGVITLSDGTTIPINAPPDVGGSRLPVVPAQTTTFTVKAVSTACGVYGPEAGSGAATVTVQPGYRIDSLSSQSVCAGQSFQVFFSTSEPIFTATGGYTLRGGSQTEAGQLAGGRIAFEVQTVAPGSKPGTGILTAVARPLPADYLANPAYGPDGALGAGRFFCQLARNGSPGGVFDKPLAVADKPQLLVDPTPITVDRPQLVYFPARLVSQLPATVTLADGTQMDVRGDIDRNQKSSIVPLEALLTGRSGTFQATAVQNGCGVGTAGGSVSVRAEGDTVGLFMRPIPDLLCANAPLLVSFAAVGNLGAVANYQVEIMDDDGMFRGRFLNGGPASPIAVTIPAGYSLYRAVQLRVVSTPASGTVRWASRARAFTYLDRSQVVRLSAAGTGGTEAISRPGEPAMLRLSSGGAVSTTVVLANGPTVVLNNLSLDVPVRPAQTTTYTVRAVQNGCGTATGTGTVTVRVQPFVVQPVLQKRVFCPADSLETALLLQGELPPQATFSIQVLLNGTVVQTLPARLTGNRLVAPLPPALTGEAHTLRVLTNVGADQFFSLPTASTFRVYRTPRLQLLPPNGQAAVVLEARQASLNVQLTNPTDPAATLLPSRYFYRINDQPYTGIDNLPVTVPLFATSATPTAYSITAVYDAYCGFGTATGAVQVSYKPGLRSLSVNKTQFCRTGDRAVVSYEAAGDLPATARFTLFLVNAAGIRTQVGESVKQTDQLVVPIDSTLAAGTYQVVLQLPPGLPPYDAFPNITVGDRPRVVVSGGNLEQYSDQTISVGIRVLSGVLPVSVTLTNGLTQTLFETDNVLTVNPQQNTSYQVARVANTCGVGQSSGVLSVTVLPPLLNEARVVAIGPAGGVSGVCQGGAIRVGISLKGAFAPDNRFTIFLSDSTGQNFRPLPTVALDATTLTAPLPPDAPPAQGYRVRIGASSPAVLGGVSSTFLTIRPGLLATLSGSRNVVRNELSPVTITLNNSGPWSVTINNSLYGPDVLTIDSSPFLYRVRPDATVTYTLLGVANQQCGRGRVAGTATLVAIDPLATDPLLPLLARVLPNPTAGLVRLEGTLPTGQAVCLRLTDLAGRQLQVHYPTPTRTLNYTLDLSQLAVGTYLLTAEANGRRVVFKIIRN